MFNKFFLTYQKEEDMVPANLGYLVLDLFITKHKSLSIADFKCVARDIKDVNSYDIKLIFYFSKIS